MPDKKIGDWDEKASSRIDLRIPMDSSGNRVSMQVRPQLLGVCRGGDRATRVGSRCVDGVAAIVTLPPVWPDGLRPGARMMPPRSCDTNSAAMWQSKRAC